MDVVAFFREAIGTQHVWRGLGFGSGSAEDVHRMHKDPVGYMREQGFGSRTYPSAGVHWTDHENSAHNFAHDRDAEGYADEGGGDDEDEGESHSHGVVLHGHVEPHHFVTPQKTAATEVRYERSDDASQELLGRSGVEARQGDTKVGHLFWHRGDEDHPAGQIAHVWVHPDHQRHGLATELLSQARQVEPRVHHSPHLSEDGRAWSGKTAAVTVPYFRNTEKAPSAGSAYGQDIEPHGRYVSERPKGWRAPEGDHRYETGEVTFQNPKHVDFGGGYGEDSNWKRQLSREHGGRTGRELSQSVRDAGHDGIITHDKYGTSEIVDLTHLKPRKTAAADSAEMPDRQRDAFDEPSFSRHRQKILDVAKDPDPGTHIWRGETRSSDQSPAEHAASGVGMHWSANPDALVHQHPDALPQGHHSVVWHGVVGDHPKAQTYDRSHPIWGGQHHSADFEAEVRLKPQSQVHLKGAYTWHGEGAPEGFVPNHPDRMHPGWKYHPLDQQAPVSHGGQHIDYDDVLGHHTAALHDSQDPSTWSDHYRDVARARPYGTAINQVHEHLHREAPRHSAPLPDDYQEANGTLHRMLGEMGHPHAEKAVLQPHLDPESRSSHSETPDGVPTVALAPQHWTYGHLAHEAAHLMDRHGRAEEWSDPDQDSHGPDFARHFSNALRTVHPTKAGADDVEPEYHAALDRIQDATGAQLSHERLGKTAATLPEGISFHFTPSWHPTKPHRISATVPHEDGRKEVGYMEWHPHNGIVGQVHTDPDHRRKGVGSALWQHGAVVAEQHGVIAPQHSDVQTAAGEAWSQKADRGGISTHPIEHLPPPEPKYHDLADHMINEHGFGSSEGYVREKTPQDLQDWHERVQQHDPCTFGKTAFYHGTAVEGVTQILPAGRYAYATTDPEAAREHALRAAEASGRAPVVYVVQALGAVEQHGAEGWSSEGWKVTGDI